MAESKTIARQVGARIRQLRTDQGMSLEKLALECGMNPAFLGHVERGLRCRSVYTLARVCTGLGISLAELFLARLGISLAELFLAAPEQENGNAAAIQHVTDRMRTLTPQQAQAVARLVDDALELIVP